MQGAKQAGFRWAYTDPPTGEGQSQFCHDVLAAGPQVGVQFKL